MYRRGIYHLHIRYVTQINGDHLIISEAFTMNISSRALYHCHHYRSEQHTSAEVSIRDCDKSSSEILIASKWRIDDCISVHLYMLRWSLFLDGMKTCTSLLSIAFCHDFHFAHSRNPGTDSSTGGPDASTNTAPDTKTDAKSDSASDSGTHQ